MRATTEGTASMRPILLLEINEVPWRVIDKVLAEGRHPSIGRFFRSARTMTTVSQDTGELSPWITWPSLHRGIANAAHGIRHLGQDPATFRGVPIWEEYRKLGLTIGVCGSLQSWPPTDPGRGGFFLPDTFAHDASCIPADCEGFQRFNLDQVRHNGRVANAGIRGARRPLTLLKDFRRAGISLFTMSRLAAQLASEQVSARRLRRRSVLQALLFWDVFKNLYRPSTPPALATFFTNHVAGVMHRYWNEIFPEDFGGQAVPLASCDAISFALRILDGILQDALGFQAANPDLLLVFATSMGQAAVHRTDHEGVEAAVVDLPRLLGALGLPSEKFKPLLAMVPQVAAEVGDSDLRSLARARLETCRLASGRPLFQVDEVGNSLSVTIVTPRLSDLRAGGFSCESSAAKSGGQGAAQLDWVAAGISMHEVDAGTAYHVPEGILALVGRGIQPSDGRKTVSATDVKGLLLETSGLRPGATSSSAARV